MWVSQLSEEVLQKDNCPSFSEPCKITLLERVDVCIYTLFFCPILTAVCGIAVLFFFLSVLKPATVRGLGCKIYLIQSLRIVM